MNGKTERKKLTGLADWPGDQQLLVPLSWRQMCNSEFVFLIILVYLTIPEPSRVNSDYKITNSCDKCVSLTITKPSQLNSHYKLTHPFDKIVSLTIPESSRLNSHYKITNSCHKFVSIMISNIKIH